MRKSITLIGFLTLCAGLLSAQTQLTAFNATGAGYATTRVSDYQSLGINPANLGWMQSKINFGMLEFNGLVFSEQLTTGQIINDLFDNTVRFSLAEKNDAARSFTDTRLFGNGSVMYLGISYQDEKFGGLAFNVRERLVWQSVFNQNPGQLISK